MVIRVVGGLRGGSQGSTEGSNRGGHIKDNLQRDSSFRLTDTDYRDSLPVIGIGREPIQGWSRLRTNSVLY